MVKTYRLITLNHALDVATTLSMSWFRGHSRAIETLIPRIFRSQYRNQLLTALRPELELATIEKFKRHAALLTELLLPPDDDRLGWLCVMQHYHAPTRLLDWSENLLVALYFTVSGDTKEDGELWAMLPWALNHAAGAGWGVPLLPLTGHHKFLLDQPYWGGTPEALAQSLELPSPVQSPLAFEPPLRFPRMAVQASTFTIHPVPEGTKTIVDVLSDPKYLVRYVVPASAKQELLKKLRVLGFSEGHLFPDLDGLSRMIAFDNRAVGYGPPDPPVCAGEVTQA
jgi:hypothetical protein